MKNLVLVCPVRGVLIKIPFQIEEEKSQNAYSIARQMAFVLFGSQTAEECWTEDYYP